MGAPRKSLPQGAFDVVTPLVTVSVRTFSSLLHCITILYSYELVIFNDQKVTNFYVVCVTFVAVFSNAGMFQSDGLPVR